MADKKGITISFGGSPKPDDGMEQEGASYSDDLKEKLYAIKEALEMGNQKAALKGINECLGASSSENEEDQSEMSKMPSKSDALMSALKK